MRHIPTGFVFKVVGYELKLWINHECKAKQLKCSILGTQVFVPFPNTASMCLYLYYKLLRFISHVSVTWKILHMQNKRIYLNNALLKEMWVSWMFLKHKPPPEFSPWRFTYEKQPASFTLVSSKTKKKPLCSV